MFRPSVAAAMVIAIAAVPETPSERIDHEVNTRIRQEGRQNSRIMRTMHYLTDLYGPRLTGSPNDKSAAEWAVKQMTEWGLQNGRLEPWEFGHPGWLNERFSGFIVSPAKDTLVGEVLAWTPSRNGVIIGEAVQVIPPERPTDAGLTAWIEQIRPSVTGKIVLVGRHTPVAVTLTKTPLRRDFDELRRQYDPVSPTLPARRFTPPREDENGRLSADQHLVDARVDDGGVYHLAMRDEMLPRFTREQMPAPRPSATTPTPTTGGDRH